MPVRVGAGVVWSGVGMLASPRWRITFHPDILANVFPMRFVSFVSFVSLVSLVSVVLLCERVHKKGEMLGDASHTRNGLLIML